MSRSKQQSLSNHMRFDPAFHYVLVPILVILLLVCTVLLVLHPGLPYVLIMALLVALFITAGRMRGYSLKVQDRIIRLEERLRLTVLVPQPMHHRIHQLTEDQLVGLRFASDDEVPALVEHALNEHLTGKQIKHRIQNWRPDHWRV